MAHPRPPRSSAPLLALAALACATTTGPAGAPARVEVYQVVEIAFAGPAFGPADSPARDVDLRARLRHEGGAEQLVHGFWDGDGQGGATGGVFKVRFTPTRPGLWRLVAVESNVPALAGQTQGARFLAVAGQRRGFWEVDPDSPGRRWFRRSDGSHQYVIGNTHYAFLSETYLDGHPSGAEIARDVRENARYFKKLRFSVVGDLYWHPVDAPFLDDAGRPTVDGRHAHRPNPAWFSRRVDRAVEAAHAHDLVADLILSGVDSPEARAALRAGSPFLKYVAARYGAYPNVWFCLINEYDIRKPRYTPGEIIDAGRLLRSFLATPNPVSVHRSAGPWLPVLNTAPAWNDHLIVQKKLRALAPTADFLQASFRAGGADKPVVNDELSYQGPGDRHTEEDTIEAHLGAFLGGGYGTTGYKTGQRPAGDGQPQLKLGQYFAGGFDPRDHTAADNLGWLREAIDREVTFWKLEPGTGPFRNLDPAARALVWAGREYVLGTSRAAQGIVADLPAGEWTVSRFDVVAKEQVVLARGARGPFVFDAPASRAVFFVFRRHDPAAERVLLDVDLAAGPGPGQVTGGAWEGGWRVTSRAGDRIVFDAGRPVAAGYLEVSYTMRRGPHEGPAAKINWVGLHEHPSLSQDQHGGDLFYVRAGDPKYRYSKVKAAGRKFDRTEWEPSVGAEADWATDDRTVQTVRLEWRDGRPRFHDPHGRVFACPEEKCPRAFPVDRLRYAFLGSDRYNGISLEGVRFLRVRLVEYVPPAPVAARG